jgi:hypothetical protein
LRVQVADPISLGETEPPDVGRRGLAVVAFKSAS